MQKKKKKTGRLDTVYSRIQLFLTISITHGDLIMNSDSNGLEGRLIDK